MLATPQAVRENRAHSSPSPSRQSVSPPADESPRTPAISLIDQLMAGACISSDEAAEQERRDQARQRQAHDRRRRKLAADVQRLADEHLAELRTAIYSQFVVMQPV